MIKENPESVEGTRTASQKKTRCHVQTNKGALVPSILPSLKELKVHPPGRMARKKTCLIDFGAGKKKRKTQLLPGCHLMTFIPLIRLFVICANLKKQSGDLG